MGARREALQVRRPARLHQGRRRGLILPRPAARPPQKVAVERDARLDLLGVVQRLALPPRALPPPPAPYAGLRRAFARLAAHPAVLRYRAIRRASRGAEPLGLLCLAWSARGGAWTRPAAAFPGEFYERAGGWREVEAFREALAGFSRASGAPRWLVERRTPADALAASAERTLAVARPLETIARYLRTPLDARMTLFASPVYAPGALDRYILPYPHAASGPPPAGPYEIWTLAGTRGVRPEEFRLPLEVPRLYDLFTEAIYLAAELAAARRGGTRGHGHQARLHLAVTALNRRIKSLAAGRPVPAGTGGGPGAAAAVRRASRRLEKEFERDAARWPDLASYWPRLLDALP